MFRSKFSPLRYRPIVALSNRRLGGMREDKDLFEARRTVAGDTVQVSDISDTQYKTADTWYDLAEETLNISKWYDISRNDNNASMSTLLNQPVMLFPEKSIKFLNSWLKIPLPTTPAIASTQGTFLFSTKIDDDYGDARVIASQHVSGYNYECRTVYTPSGLFYFYVPVNNGTYQLFGNWGDIEFAHEYNFCITWDDKRSESYIDDVLKNIINLPAPSLLNGYSMNLGGWATAGQFHGTIKKFYIYNIKLSLNQIKRLNKNEIYP